MNSILHFETLLPIALLILQTLVLFFVVFLVLKRFGILKAPYAGLEYSQVILASVCLFAVFFISTADIGALFQAFKTFQNAGTKVLSSTYSKFIQFFLVILFFEIMLWLTGFLIIKVMYRFKNSLKEIKEGNIPAAILMSVVVISLGVVFQYSAREIIEYIIPRYINFR